MAGTELNKLARLRQQKLQLALAGLVTDGVVETLASQWFTKMVAAKTFASTGVS